MQRVTGWVMSVVGCGAILYWLVMTCAMAAVTDWYWMAGLLLTGWGGYMYDEGERLHG